MKILKTLRTLSVIATATVAATAGHASVINFEFVTKTWSRGLNGGTGNTDAYLSSKGIGGFGFSFGGQDVGFAGGFFNDGSAAQKQIHSTVQTTYGPGSEPSSSIGYSVFVQGGGNYAPIDIVNGNVGFKTTDGNYGYVVFDWNAVTDTMTFVSGAYDNTAGVAITTPSAVPLPAAFPLLLAALGGLGFVARRRKTG